MPWQVVCSLESLADGEPVAFRCGETELALCKVAVDIFAFANVCTHQYALLSDGFVDGDCIECPLHQGQFSMKTGEPISAPVTVPIRVFPTRVEDGHVLVEVE